MEKSKLFRKSSLDRINSPEQLNEYIKIMNPSLILILVSIFLILFGCGVWFFSGSIPKNLDIKGTITNSKNGETMVYSYVPISTAKMLKEGMDVEISPDYASKQEYGYIHGKIMDIGEEVVTEEYLYNNLESPNVVLPRISENTENLLQIQINMLGWTNEKGEEISLTNGSTCEVSVVEREQKPYELIFNS